MAKADTQTADVDLSQKEAPQLAEQVAAGTLPALEDRLPVEGDTMVEQVEELGEYGGSMTVTTLDNGPYTSKTYNCFQVEKDGKKY